MSCCRISSTNPTFSFSDPACASAHQSVSAWVFPRQATLQKDGKRNAALQLYSASKPTSETSLAAAEAANRSQRSASTLQPRLLHALAAETNAGHGVEHAEGKGETPKKSELRALPSCLSSDLQSSALLLRPCSCASGAASAHRETRQQAHAHAPGVACCCTHACVVCRRASTARRPLARSTPAHIRRDGLAPQVVSSQPQCTTR